MIWWHSVKIKWIQISFDIGAIFYMLYSVDNVAKIYHTIYFTFLLGVDIATDEIMINFTNNIL